MKKLLGAVIAAAAMVLAVGCNSQVAENEYVEYGTLTVGSMERYLASSEVKTATVKVYYGKDKYVASSTTASLSDGATVSPVTVENIPTGKNRVVEVVGYKDTTQTVEGKRLYYVMDIVSGSGNSCTVTEGETSAKGKAYLALLNAGVDVSGVSLTGFTSGKSSYYFDADSFAAAYKSSSSASPAGYYTAAGTVSFTNISNASGYTVWIDDPISSKLSITSSSTTTASISDVAPGTWRVYVNDGSSTTQSGTVTVSNGSGTYSTLIGVKTNPLAGKTVIFVKCSANTNLYAWTATSKTELAGGWSGTTLTTAATSDYMYDPTGWYMLDVTSIYGSSTETINIILIPSGGSQSADLLSGIAGTFWYDGTTFYDKDPTEPDVDTDVTLSDIKVNGTSIGSSATSYTIGKNVTSATVTATATSSNAVVTVTGTSSIASGSSSVFTITVTNNGESATYTLTVSRAAANDTSLSSITVNSKAATISGTTAACSMKGTDESLSITSITATPVDSDATVVYSATTGTVADGGSSTFTITVTNGTASATYTLTVSYTMQSSSNEYYWTNKNGYGANTTISSWSDWTEDMKIAQGAANDDPRVFCHWSMHENPNDVYAMFAAYDSTNLYIMLELSNVQDIVAPGESYPLSDNGQYWNRSTPFFFAFDTGKGVGGDGSMVSTSKDAYIWGSDVHFSENNVDKMIVCHSLPSKGTPGVFSTDSTGKFSYASDLCLTWAQTGVSVSYDGGANQTQGLISKNLYGIQAVGTDQGRLAANIDTDTYVDFYSAAIGHDSDLDLKWQITIPLTALDIDYSYLTTHGIGVMFVLSDGGSGMDCLPWDSCMIDNAATPYSKDESSSAEKEDTDVITSSFARIGHN